VVPQVVSPACLIAIDYGVSMRLLDLRAASSFAFFAYVDLNEFHLPHLPADTKRPRACEKLLTMVRRMSGGGRPQYG